MIAKKIAIIDPSHRTSVREAIERSPLELPISRPTAGHIEYGPCIKRTGAEMDESGANNSLLIKADDRRLGESGLKTAIQHRIGVRVFSFFARAACD